jgi:phage shock protein PspC (stress-responsive transcriptional regulator)
MPDPATKRCPQCTEEIRAEARKCRFCGSLVEGGTPLTRTWYRTREGRMIAGVSAGLAEQFGISVTIVRLAFLLSALFGGGMGFVIYLVLWVVMPYRPEAGLLPSRDRPSGIPPPQVGIGPGAAE